MSKNIKTVCFVLVAVLLSTCLFGCAPEQEWTDENVIFAYDESGDVTITFPDNFVYPKYPVAKMVEFNVSSEYPYLADFYEWFDLTLEQNEFDSVYLIKVIKLLTVEEAKKLDAYMYPMSSYSTYYEIVVIYDYLNEKEINQTHYFRFARGTAENQRKGLPPFQNGDTFISICSSIDYRILGCTVMEPFYILDKEISDDTFVYKMHSTSQDMADIAIELMEEEKTIVSAYEENPRIFSQKFKLGDLIEFIRNALEERGYEIQK
ncbi:MAG: hypothetical protein PHI78_04205 [Clostridia bacterium]|nr:hypothetical protein [Clostridia bacterium]